MIGCGRLVGGRVRTSIRDFDSAMPAATLRPGGRVAGGSLWYAHTAGTRRLGMLRGRPSGPLLRRRTQAAAYLDLMMAVIFKVTGSKTANSGGPRPVNGIASR